MKRTSLADLLSSEENGEPLASLWRMSLCGRLGPVFLSSAVQTGQVFLRCLYRRMSSLPKNGRRQQSMTLVLILIAGLMGASGVVLAAAAAHAKSGMGLDGAGYLLLFHAVAVLSGVALLRQGLLLRPLVLGVLSGWVLGSALFAGDIALRAFVGYRLFPMAAPTGGVVLILAWLALAVAAILALLHS